MTENGTLRGSPPKIWISVKKGETDRQEYSFTDSFSIGRDEDCEVQVKDSSVSRVHAEVYFSEGRWWIRDLNSANGILVDGKRVDRLPLLRPTQIELGADGPVLSLELKEITGSITIPAKKDPSITQYVKQYFSESSGKDAGEHTMYIRKAFERVQKKQKGKYFIIIGAAAVLLLIAGTVVVLQHTKLRKQEQIAIDLFYDMKSLELEIAKLKERVNVGENVSRLSKMSENYGQFIDNLGVYTRKMSQEDRLILKMASIFGECEVNIPDKLFVQEVKKYIKKWQSTKDFPIGIRKARQNSYPERIYRVMRSHNLPPQFFYLALQESGFNTDACGPQTRFGYAKGMWQFIPDTGKQFGLRIGPLAQYRRPDPEDDRHDFEKSTKAAAEYIQSIYNTRAQASGLLVMASYNWGERRVIRLIDQMPDNPRERNFWRLLEDHVDRIPKQTYDYVFRIFSAAVIGENPRYFGFEFSNPLEEVNTRPSQ
jgi:membrane-bound lytic murein transglycosylase D